MKEKESLYVMKMLHRVLVFIVIKWGYLLWNYHSPADKQTDEEICMKINAYLIAENHFLDKEINIKKVALKIGIKKEDLNKVLRVKYNMTFYKYLTQLRIQYSSKLLLDQKNTLVEVVAEESGFNSIRTFERNFKCFNNSTPSEYRRIYALAQQQLLVENASKSDKNDFV